MLLSITLVPAVSAVNYDIGRVSSSGSEVDWYLYDSGVSLKISNDKYLDYLHLILDGNESTGLDHNFGADSSAFNVIIHFPFPIFVNNITIKPVFNGSASSCMLFVEHSHFGVVLASAETQEKTYDVNVKIDSMQLTIDNGGTNHFYFNDILINYVMIPTNINEVIESIIILTNQITNLTNEYNNIKNELETINNYLYDADNQLLENITQLWNSFNMLNQSVNYLTDQLQQLNVSVYRNITRIESDVTSIKEDISNIYEAIQNLMDDDDNDRINDIQDQLNDTASDINNLYDNVTLIRKNILEGLDDSDQPLLDRIFQLENENTILRQEIDNLTKRMDNLKDSETKTIIEDDDGNNNMIYGALGLGLIAIVIAIISMFVKKPRPVDEDDKSDEQPLPEPQVQSVVQPPPVQQGSPPPQQPQAPEIPTAQEATVLQPAPAEQVQENDDQQQSPG
jgi:regulator of replication initiation timing